MKNKIFLTGLAVVMLESPALATLSGGNGIFIDFAECQGDPLTYNNDEKTSGTFTYEAQWEACAQCNPVNADCELNVVNNTCQYSASCKDYYTNLTGNGTTAPSCEPETYTITYVMNGGTNYVGALNSYTYGVGATINGIPVQTGKKFIGWCTDSSLQVCSNTQTISTVDHGDKTFYAKWSDCPACNAGEGCTCSFSGVENNECKYTTGAQSGYSVISGSNTNTPQCAGGAINLIWQAGEDATTQPSPTTGQCTYGGNITLPVAPTKEGYRFTGWKLVGWTE